MGKTALFSRQQPGGVFSFYDESQTTGDIYWVSSGTGTDQAGSGSNPDDPVATLDFAVGLCTAGQMDRIYLMPGHAESIGDDDEAVMDVSGVEVIGLGSGALQATFTLDTATDATIIVTAPNCKIKNIKIISDFADVAAGITAGALADGLIVEDCWLTDGASDEELVIGISIAAACDNVTIRGNRFRTVDAGGCASAIKFIGATTDSLVSGNDIYGDYSAAGIDDITAAAVRLTVEDNSVHNTDVTAGLAIGFHASSTGHFVRNLVFGGKDGTSPFSAAAAMHASQNYGTNAPGASGIILPGVDA